MSGSGPVAFRRSRSRVTMHGVAFALLLVFAASVPLEAIGQLGVLGSAARVAGIAAALAGALALCTDLPVRRSHGTLFLFGAFVVWVALSYYWSEDAVKTITRTATFVQLLFLAWLIWQEVRTSRACAALMQAYVAGASIACLDAIISRRPAHGGVVRFAVGDPNDFGVVVVIGMVMAYHLIVTTRSRVTRIACVAFLPLGTVAVFLTASRTAVIALFAAAIVAVVDRRNLTPRRVAVLGVVVAIMLFAVLHLVSPSQLQRVGSVGSETANSTLDERTSLWKLSYEAFSQHPLLGIGADAFRDRAFAATGQPAPAHNSFFDVLGDLGIPGLVLFGVVIGSLVRPMMRLPRRFRRTWLTIALIWLLGASTLSWEHRKITWFLAFLLLAQSYASPVETRDADRSDASARDLSSGSPPRLVGTHA